MFLAVSLVVHKLVVVQRVEATGVFSVFAPGAQASARVTV